MKVKRTLPGNTLRLKWISSGTTVSSVGFSVYTGSETAIDSGTLTSSGGGHYYAHHTTPNTPGYYAVEFVANVGSQTYKRRSVYRVVLEEVD